MGVTLVREKNLRVARKRGTAQAQASPKPTAKGRNKFGRQPRLPAAHAKKKRAARNALDVEVIPKPVKIVSRRETTSRPAESYLVDGSGVYISGVTSRSCVRHAEVASELAELIRAGQILTRAGARLKLRRLMIAKPGAKPVAKPRVVE